MNECRSMLLESSKVFFGGGRVPCDSPLRLEVAMPGGKGGASTVVTDSTRVYVVFVGFGCRMHCFTLIRGLDFLIFHHD